MSNTIATYLCTGCGIGDALDMDMMNEAAGEVSAEIKTHEALCQESGRAMIQADIDGGVNSVAICACSMRVMQEEFNFGDEVSVSRGNIREGAVWSAQKPSEERDEATVKEFTTQAAGDILRMAVTQAEKTELPEAFKLETTNKDILVMGGGIAAAGFSIVSWVYASVTFSIHSCGLAVVTCFLKF